ncbi:hypothetical protein C8Q72DRAFT_800210 [Fomitopsis betulina]|nr:hypothetical protein C8Q72DRAFT_800210 [Fomitopsis betulina]
MCLATISPNHLSLHKRPQVGLELPFAPAWDVIHYISSSRVQHHIQFYACAGSIGGCLLSSHLIGRSLETTVLRKRGPLSHCSRTYKACHGAQSLPPLNHDYTPTVYSLLHPCDLFSHCLYLLNADALRALKRPDIQKIAKVYARSLVALAPSCRSTATDPRLV